MPLLVAIVGAVSGLAFWRRKKLKDDAQRIGEAARDRVQRRPARKKLLTELGQHYYAESTNGDDVDHQAEMARIVDQLSEIDSESAGEDGAATAVEAGGDASAEPVTST